MDIFGYSEFQRQFVYWQQVAKRMYDHDFTDQGEYGCFIKAAFEEEFVIVTGQYQYGDTYNHKYPAERLFQFIGEVDEAVKRERGTVKG